jgi:Carboxypeptidase regulatory-like domain
MHVTTDPHKRTSAGLRLSAVVLVLAIVPALLRAQQPISLPSVPSASVPAAPIAPVAATPSAQSAESPATLAGTVTDPSGAVIAGASITVTVENAAARAKLTVTSASDGTFTFTAIPPGKLSLSITAIGFASSKPRQIVAQPGQAIDLQEIPLEITAVDSTVQAASQEEIAEQQIHVEEQQRIFGVVPNFYVSYVWNAAPLTPGQKFRLALRASVDPFTFVGAGVAAGIEQSQDTYPGYGLGASGYAKRYGAAYADGFIGNMLGDAVFPSLFHQDPRYFYKGTGSTTSRALYALSTAFRARGDDGHWEPNYSNVLGDLAAGAISNAYYPAADRGVQTTFDNAFIALGGSAVGALVQEFVLRKLTRHPPTVPAAQ